MKIFTIEDMYQIASALNAGSVGAMPTDTVFGFVGKAHDRKIVERIYEIKKRDSHKPFIVLISSVEEISKFGTAISEREKMFLNKLWPDKVSVVLINQSKEFEYLHRGKKSLAFRMPNSKWLLEVLEKTGPLVAPSANHQGEDVIKHHSEALEKFKDEIDFVVQEPPEYGERTLPSTVIKVGGGSVEILREGRVSEAFVKKVWDSTEII